MIPVSDVSGVWLDRIGRRILQRQCFLPDLSGSFSLKTFLRVTVDVVVIGLVYGFYQIFLCPDIGIQYAEYLLELTLELFAGTVVH